MEDVQSEIVKEASAMSCLNHPNLIQLFGVLVTSPMMLVSREISFSLLIKSNVRNIYSMNVNFPFVFFSLP